MKQNTMSFKSPESREIELIFQHSSHQQCQPMGIESSSTGGSRNSDKKVEHSQRLKIKHNQN